MSLFHLTHRPPAVLVREYTNRRSMEHEARRLATKGYRIAGTSQATHVGLPSLTHGILHTRTTVTYQFTPTLTPTPSAPRSA